jgi:protein associated with RNAse G/E
MRRCQGEVKEYLKGSFVPNWDAGRFYSCYKSDMKAGDRIVVHAYKAFGDCYRWWPAMVESIDDERVMTMSRVGHSVRGPKGGWVSKFDIRGVYWFDRPYNLVEVYLPSGKLKQVYIHIASPVQRGEGSLTYTDHELDVVRRPGQPVRIVDEHEFEEAAEEYGYSAAFQSACRHAVNEALQVAATWSPSGAPRRPYRRRQAVRTSTPAADSSTRNTEV